MEHIITTIPLLAGLLMSVIHVLSGPDHLAAVTPLAVECKKKAGLVGVAWGVGHTIGMLLIGLLFLLFKDYMDVEIISQHGEQLVGIMLIGIGVWLLRKINKSHDHGFFHGHPHGHSHGGTFHVHLQSHQGEDGKEHLEEDEVINQKQNFISALSIGIFHGVAGVSHLIAILPTLALPSKTASILYLSGFAIGTILAMFVYAFLLGRIAIKSASRENKTWLLGLRVCTSFLAIGVGIFWLL